MTTYMNIGISGLRAAQMGLLTTQHNIANVNTAGFSRQASFQSTGYAINSGDGALGQGVKTETVKRSYSDFLTAQVSVSQSRLSELDTLFKSYSQIDNVLADPQTGLAPTLRDFFASVQQVSANPSQLTARQAMVSSAQTLASRFQLLDGQVASISEQINDRIMGAVEEINALSAGVAELNQSIVIAQSAYGQPANDLLDKRDSLIAELNKLVGVSTSSNLDGSVNVYFGSGQQLVFGNQSALLKAQPQAADAGKMSIALVNRTGSVELPDSLIRGGELGAMIDFRNGALLKTNSALGQLAASIALTMNAQQTLGQDLYGQIDGESGFVGNLFSIPSPRVQANTTNAPTTESVQASYTPLSNADGYFTTALTAETYRLTTTGGIPSVVRLSDNQSVAIQATGPASYRFDGIDIDLSGAPTSGNSFLIKPAGDAAREITVNSNVVADPRLLASAMPVRSAQNVANLGNMSLVLAGVAPGYSATPVSFTVQTNGGGGLELSGLSGAWTATYANGGTVVTGNDEIPLSNAGARLTSLTINGLTFDVQGVAQSGDRFVIERNAAGVQDGRNVAMMADLQTAKTIAGGRASFSSVYSEIVGTVAVQTREAKIRLEAQETLHTQLLVAKDSISGVNLDEEAANLLKFQQAYQASAKALQIGVSLFEQLLAIR